MRPLSSLLRHGCLGLLVVAGALATSAAAVRAHSITEYPLPPTMEYTFPSGITTGPDGNLWFTGDFLIWKVTPTGAFTNYAIPSSRDSESPIVTGPDGNLWFTERYHNRIGNVSTAGVFTEYPIPTAASGVGSITLGPDGNLWFTEANANQIGKVTPTGVFTEYPIPTASSAAASITAGPDGNLWFTEFDGNKIGKLTPGGVFTEYTLPTVHGRPNSITAGPDGNLWFTEWLYKIGKVTTSGSFTEYDVPNPVIHPNIITLGPDGNLWFTQIESSKIGKVTPSGTFTEYAFPTHSDYVLGITAGPDGNVWFSESDLAAKRIGKLTPTGPLCTAAPAEGCHAPAIAQKASLQLKSFASDGSKNTLVWKWNKGSATAKVPEFGVPTMSTDYQLCIYDGASALVGDAFVPAGGMCAGKPCWSETSKGFKYKSKDGAADSIRQILLKEGVDGKAQITVKGKGDAAMASPPLAPPVRVQLVNSTGACWEATYSAPTTNSAGSPAKFKAKAD